MDERVRPASGSRRAPRWAHDWHPYDDYLNVHSRYMTEMLEAGLILRDNLSRVETRDRGELITVRIHGNIECARDVRVVVDKWLDVRRDERGRHQVKGRRYVYQALLRKNITILRYDNSHGDDQLHRHAHGEEEPTPISLADLPTLTGFIEESLTIASKWAEATD